METLTEVNSRIDLIRNFHTDYYVNNPNDLQLHIEVIFPEVVGYPSDFRDLIHDIASRSIHGSDFRSVLDHYFELISEANRRLIDIGLDIAI